MNKVQIVAANLLLRAAYRSLPLGGSLLDVDLCIDARTESMSFPSIGSEPNIHQS